MKKEFIMAVDLGTTNSVAAIFENGQPKVIPNAEGGRTTPSVVGYSKDDILVGESAKRQQITNPKNTVYSSKRFIGMKHAQVADEAKFIPYEVKQSTDGSAIFSINNKDISPQEIGAKVLLKLKKAVEDYLGEPVAKAIITVPAYFDNAQRQATKDAGTIAGLEVLRVINEPTAAALAYGFDKKKDQKILIYDLGGGTFDVSVLEVGSDIIEVIATSGDTHLGGDDFDNRLLNHIADEFLAKEGIDLRKDSLSLQRLRAEAERAKKELSSLSEVEINLPFITADASGPKHLNCKVNRAKFESLIEDLIDKSFVCVKKVMDDSKLKISEIDEVIFVGGSTRIPMVGEKVKKMFDKEPNRSVNPDEIVALGAAVQAGMLAGEQSDLLLLDVTSLSLGLETLGGVMTTIIPRNTTIPTKKSQVFSTAADNQTSVTVAVAQGERKLFSDNQFLATFNLDGIPPSPRGIPQIEVSFDIDANGIVHVSAKDKATGKDKGVTIKSGLSSEEIDKMIKDAELHAADDERKAKEIILINDLDTLLFSAEKTLKDSAEQLADYDLTSLREAIDQAHKVVKDRKAEDAEAAKQKLTAALHKMSEHMYAKTAPKQEESNNPQQTSTPDDIIDVTPEVK